MANVTPTVPVRGAPLASVNVPENLIHRGNGLEGDVGALMRVACASSPLVVVVGVLCPQLITDALIASVIAAKNFFKPTFILLSSHYAPQCANAKSRPGECFQLGG